MFAQYSGAMLMETSSPKSNETNTTSPPNLCRNTSGSSLNSSSSSPNRTSTGRQFSAQLNESRRMIASTMLHYMLFLKHNGLSLSDKFDCAVIVYQLRCAVMLEAMRASHVGFPQRHVHQRFVDRYRILGWGKVRDVNSHLQQDRLHRHVYISVRINQRAVC